MQRFEKVTYELLNPRQGESYNYQKISGVLSDQRGQAAIFAPSSGRLYREL